MTFNHYNVACGFLAGSALGVVIVFFVALGGWEGPWRKRLKRVGFLLLGLVWFAGLVWAIGTIDQAENPRLPPWAERYP